MLFICGFVTFIPLYQSIRQCTQHPDAHRPHPSAAIINRHCDVISSASSDFIFTSGCHVTVETLWIEFARRRQTRTWLIWAGGGKCGLCEGPSTLASKSTRSRIDFDATPAQSLQLSTRLFCRVGSGSLGHQVSGSEPFSRR